MKTKLNYSGEKTQSAIEKFLKKESMGCYVFARVIFGDVIAYKTDKILSNPQAPSDYPYGYYKNGVLTQWSEKRKITDQNTGVING